MTVSNKTIDPANAIRAIRSGKEKNAWRWLKGGTVADLELAKPRHLFFGIPCEKRFDKLIKS